MPTQKYMNQVKVKAKSSENALYPIFQYQSGVFFMITDIQMMSSCDCTSAKLLASVVEILYIQYNSCVHIRCMLCVYFCSRSKGEILAT